MPAPSPARYWRLALTQTAGNAYAMAEVQFRATAGTPLLFSGGAASATQTYNGAPGTYDASHATDNDPSTFWSSNDSGAGQSWAYDYGSGAALAIVEVTIQARNDSYASQTPAAFSLQSSPDGTSWADVADFTAQSWSGGQVQTFTVPVPGSTKAQASQAVVEVVAGNAAPPAAASQAVVEIVAFNPRPPAAASQVFFEAVATNPAAPAAASQAFLELIAATGQGPATGGNTTGSGGASEAAVSFVVVMA